jgi:hypothetical protein
MSVCIYCVWVVVCVGSGLARGWSPVQGVLPTVYRIKKRGERPRSKGLSSQRKRDLPQRKIASLAIRVRFGSQMRTRYSDWGFPWFSSVKTEINRRGISLRWPRNTLNQQRLAVTSPTSGGRSVGIVRLRTTVTEFSFFSFSIESKGYDLNFEYADNRYTQGHVH